MVQWSRMKFIPTYTQNEDGLYGSGSEHPALQYYKDMPEAFDPVWGTEYAACFDLKACLPLDSKVTAYGPDNEKIIKTVSRKMDDERGYILIEPRERVLVPTGLRFNIPVGYSMRLHSRSGLALKQGLVLANHEGVVDSDYVDPTYIVLTNDSDVPAYIFHGDRIGQGEMQIDIAYQLWNTQQLPQPKTDRKGGFGSTGKA